MVNCFVCWHCIWENDLRVARVHKIGDGLLLVVNALELTVHPDLRLLWRGTILIHIEH